MNQHMTITTFAKGLSKYSFNTIEEELTYAWNSIYRYWWFALRCSRDYWWVCQEKGKTLDPELKRVYKAFGPVHGRTFSDWWRYSARENFKEEIAPPKAMLLSSRAELDNFIFEDNEWMLLRVPLNIKEPKLIEDFVQILRSHPNRKNLRNPTAKFPLRKHQNIQLDVYENAFWLWQETELSGDRQRVGISKGISYYDLGVKYNVNPKHVMNGPDDLRKHKKRNAMKVTVHRMLGKVDALIANAEIGIFPSESLLEARERWKPSQLKRLEKALADGEWQPQLMTNKEWAAELKQVHVEEEANREETDMFASPRYR
jgi:hypothetical protein